MSIKRRLHRAEKERNAIISTVHTSPKEGSFLEKMNSAPYRVQKNWIKACFDIANLRVEAVSSGAAYFTKSGRFSFNN